MENLPDDVLVTLMEYLDVEDLLACRLVCKRVGGLALHRDVWRHRQLPGSRCVCPVLRLAPCVASLNLELQHHHRCGLAYIATRCAVTRLSLSLREDYDAMRAAAVICRQETLGRLKVVEVGFGNTQSTDVSYLLGALATTADLEELQVTGLTYHVTATAAAAAILGSPVSTPSLRFFRCELLPKTQHFVNFILAGHAATLQRVDLGHWRYGTDSTGHLLGCLPNLRQLKCSNLPGLEAVAACESLQDLDLVVRMENGAAVAGAAQLLRRAKNLREVRLEYWPLLCFAEQDGVNLLLDLAGRSCLEKLTVYNHYDSLPAFFPVQTLVSVLPSLSALVHLKVDADVRPDELLLAITPDVAPALQEVDVWLQCGTCCHAWIHGDAVKAVLSANPSLHLGVDIVDPTCRDRCCATCVLGCHVVLREFETRGSLERFFYLFSHDPTVRCSWGHRNDDWIHVPV